MATGRQQIESEFPQGHRLGRYRIEEPVGQGGMGTVYCAFDETTNRNVAVKILAPGISEALRERFLAECEAQAKIRHPHVMPVYDQAWLTDERPYFTMELLYDPVTLAEIVEWVGDGSLSKRYARIRHWADPVKLVRDVILPVSDGIAVANGEYRIQHRDLKPDNILIDTRTRRAYVIDFGICRDIDGVQAETKIVGTPRFLSPEQARGQVDARTDVWGLGCLVHYAITGRPPLRGSSQFTRPQVDERIVQLLRAEQKAEAEGRAPEARGYRARREQFEAKDFRTLEDLYSDARKGVYLPLPEDVSTSLKAIVDKAMAAAPEERYDTAQAYVEDLARWVRGGTVQALAETDSTAAAVDAAKRALQRNLPRVVGVVVALVLGLLIGRAAFKEPPSHPDFRAVDIRSTIADLTEEARVLSERDEMDALDARSARTAWQHIQDQTRGLRARLASVSAGERSALEPVLAAFETRVAPHRLAIAGGDAWRIVDVTADPPTSKPYEGVEKTALEPGLYQLRHTADPLISVRLHVPLPLRDSGAAIEPLRPELPTIPSDPPPGMAWVPVSTGNGGPGGLLVTRRLVTCEQYGEYLDDIPAAKRPARLPPKGFHQGDPNDSSRWLAKAEYQDKPVTGLDADDVSAYLTWLSDTYGLAYRLLTDAEWQHAAGVELLGTPGEEHLFPYLRREKLKEPPRTSPYGVNVRVNHKGYGELVQGEAGALLVKGDDVTKPWLAKPSAFARSVIYAPESGGEYGFRVCVEPQ